MEAIALQVLPRMPGGYSATKVGHGTTNADAGVGIGLKKGGFKNLIEKGH